MKNTLIKHLTVTGFTADVKTSSTSKLKAGREKIKQAKENLFGATADFDDAFESSVQHFKKDSITKIDAIEADIAELKKKVLIASNELGLIYQNQVDELVHTKKNLINQLHEYTTSVGDEWKSFKLQFNKEMRRFEKTLAGILSDFRNVKESRSNKREGKSEL